MIVSWNWLKQYVGLERSVKEVTDRLTMAGFNLESVEEVAGDTAIDLEITSNRPDCLGHIGVAREVSVLFDGRLQIPAAQPASIAQKTPDATSVNIDCEDLCPQYIARVIRGVKIGPSPKWLQDRLTAIGITCINNVVDVTNYVLMECGQPLHAFDFDKLHGQKIIVRRARAGEKIVAIDQREYALDGDMCVIADADRPVAIGGVMGGLATEISSSTKNVLIEAARFTPMSIRSTARKLTLHSDSSFRFERGVDPQNLDWASRRCCELILETGGGELLSDSVVAGSTGKPNEQPITLRFEQIPRVLGIDVPRDEALRILKSLGLTEVGKATASSAQFTAPSWRRDLEREIDLIEEVARVYGYERIPDNVPVPLYLSAKTPRDRVTGRVRDTLTASGFYEAVTLSFVSDAEWNMFTPRGEFPQVKVDHSTRRHENALRQSLIPSLLKCRRENERHGTFNAELFEIAKVYLRAAKGRPEREVEPMMIGLVSGRSFQELKGVVETLANRINRVATVTVQSCSIPQFVEGRGAEVLLDGKPWGWIGELDRSVTDQLDLRDAVTCAELDLAVLQDSAALNAVAVGLPQFPSMQRDLNFVLDEGVTWQQLETAVRGGAGELLEAVSFGGQYRGKQIEAGKKSYLVGLVYRAPDRTLTSEEVDRAQEQVIATCAKQLSATLRA